MKQVLCCFLIIIFLVMCCITPVSASEIEDDVVESSYYYNEKLFLRYGDVDLDKVVTSIDVVYILRYLVFLYDSAYMYLGDVDCDGYVTVMDATQIQRYLAGFGAIEYGDCTGVCVSSDKTSVAKSVYDNVKGRFGLWNGSVSDEGIAACLTWLNYEIEFDASRGYTTYGNPTKRGLTLIFYDLPDAILYGIEDEWMEDTMHEWAIQKRRLYYCMFEFYDIMLWNNGECTRRYIDDDTYRIANYYYHCIQDWK